MSTLTSIWSMTTADRDGIAAAQTLVGAGNLTIDGALASGGVAALDKARRITLYSTGNLSGVTFTATGTDRYGRALTEAITGPNNSTVTSTKNFKTVTQVAASGAVGTNVECGSAAVADTAWMPVAGLGMPVSVQAQPSSGAVLEYSVQYTLLDVDVASSTFDEHSLSPLGLAGAEYLAAGVSGVLNAPVGAIRCAVTSYTSGTLSLLVRQAG